MSFKKGSFWGQKNGSDSLKSHFEVSQRGCLPRPEYNTDRNKWRDMAFWKER